MKRKSLLISGLSFMFVLAFSALAMAAGEGAGTADTGLIMAASLIAAGLAVGGAGGGCGAGMGNCARGLLEGTARNPEMAGKLTVSMFITFALIETFTIYALVIGLIALYANPFLG
ncbi:ATP synthase F0 sector subunit c [Dissulfuribacter thermophilus]|uniref:ATP synthase subunit c n=1 Tax=Dissulfuribacter thermophilus TaxID=1156395 RepID=A0A1B9F7D8_9BACT|nr:ATP synthase F0 subunit C [Dissulfuribacter thermophilus]OCC15764.1 ATP synthase F0 sector subunit c [Dissulfuribacter thermophilus]